MEQAKTMYNILRKLTQPTLFDMNLHHKVQLTPAQGDNAEEIFLNGVEYARAEIALNLRRELKKINTSDLDLPSDKMVKKINFPVFTELTLELDEKEADSRVLTLAEGEKQLILRTLEMFGGNKMRTAQALDITSKTLYNKLHSYGLM